ncbi:MAG: caspase family protein [Alphaproteobacteria bacterium]|nr:caspase family protein [Alphaproteobacteria bacterium]
MRAFVLGALFLLAVVPASDAGMTVMPHGRALVIGNAGYAAMPLRNAAGDARAVADRLEALGFVVTTQIDATGAAMNAAIGKFAAEIGDGDDDVVYYVGCGTRLRGVDLLVPVDADLDGEDIETALLLGGGVPADTMLRLLARRGARTTLVMLDTNFIEFHRDERRRRALAGAVGGAGGGHGAVAGSAARHAGAGRPGRRPRPLHGGPAGRARRARPDRAADSRARRRGRARPDRWPPAPGQRRQRRPAHDPLSPHVALIRRSPEAGALGAAPYRAAAAEARRAGAPPLIGEERQSM